MRNKHKTLIAAAAMQGIMLGFWSAGWLCWACENVGLSPDFLMLLAAALIFCLIFEIIQILQKLSIAWVYWQSPYILIVQRQSPG